MFITEFKKGDIITRNAAVSLGVREDCSYCGSRLEFVGVDEVAKIIHFIDERGDHTKLSYASLLWNDGWCKYNDELDQEAKSMIK